jgi:signal transduction histidine kinase
MPGGLCRDCRQLSLACPQDSDDNRARSSSIVLGWANLFGCLFVLGPFRLEDAMWKKVVGPTLLMTFLWLSTSGATTVYIFWLTDSNTRILQENVSSIRAAGMMQESLWKLQSAFLDAVAGQDAIDIDQQSVEIHAIQERFLESCQAAQDASVAPVEIDLVRTIRSRFSEYRDLIDHGLQLESATREEEALLIDRSTQLAQSVASPCAQIVQVNEGLMDNAVAHRSQMERSYNFVRLAFLIAGPAIGIWVGLRIARNLHQSISQISVTLKGASGDLDQEIGLVDVVPPENSGDLSVLNEQVQLISARVRQVLAELNRARKEAEVSERLAVVGGLAAGVAHEIRNPLTSVKLLIQTASPHSPGGITIDDRQTQVILQEILRMEETIQALLDFARPPRLNRICHDLRDTIRRALNLVEGRARLQGVEVFSELPDVPLLVDGDPEQLHQVFVNLLINGIDSMHDGGVLHVTAEGDRVAGRCRVVVADSGAGIPPERIDRIFDPFMTTKPRGTGLGLAVTRRIVREHGGLIIADNRAEGGARFRVELQAFDAGDSGLPAGASQGLLPISELSFATTSPPGDV